MTTLPHVATVDSARNVFTLINTFQVVPEHQRPLVEELAAVTESTMQFLPGFIGASVHRSLDGLHVTNYVQWESRAHFDAMLVDPKVKQHLERVQALAVSVRPVFYEVAFVGARPAP